MSNGLSVLVLLGLSILLLSSELLILQLPGTFLFFIAILRPFSKGFKIHEE